LNVFRILSGGYKPLKKSINFACDFSEHKSFYFHKLQINRDLERFLTVSKNKVYEGQNDESLISKYLEERELEILGILYQRYIYLVYGVCMKYLKDRDRSKDFVMQIFEKLIVEIDKHQILNFRSWLYVVTKHYCMRELKREAIQMRKIREISDEDFMESTVEMSPLDEMPGKDPDEALKSCMEKLKNEQKECIDLFYFQEKCYQEISGILNISLNKVKSYIQNGKRNLKICLEKQDE